MKTIEFTQTKIDGDLGFGTCSTLDCGKWAILKFQGEPVCLECFEARMEQQMKSVHDLYHQIYPEKAKGATL